MIKKIIFITTFLILNISGHCQNWQWSTDCGGASFDEIATICTDANNNTYFTGGLGNIFGTDTVIGNYFWRMGKLTPTGNYQWIKTSSKTGWVGTSDFSTHIAHNKKDDGVFIGGQYNGNIKIDTVQLPISMIVGDHIYIFRYDLNGNLQWSKTFGGNDTYNTGIESIVSDQFGNLILRGQTSDTIDFGTGNVLPGRFLVKFDKNGNCIWSKRISPVNTLGFFDKRMICSSSNQIILLGYSNTGEVLDGYSFTDNGNFIAKFSASGILQSVKQFSLSSKTFMSLGIDNKNNVYVCGNINLSSDDSVTVDGITLYNYMGYGEAYVYKLDSNLMAQWGRVSKCSWEINVSDIAVDTSGQSYISGLCRDVAEFDGHYITPTAILKNTHFLVSYDKNGTCLGALSGNCNSAVGPPDFPSVVDYLSGGGAVIAGEFVGTVDFGISSVTSAGNRDIYIAKTGIINNLPEPNKKIESNKLLIYANPNNGKCVIDLPQGIEFERNLKLLIYDQAGKIVQQIPLSFEQDNVKIDIQAQAKGTYNVVLCNNNIKYTGKIIFE